MKQGEQGVGKGSGFYKEIVFDQIFKCIFEGVCFNKLFYVIIFYFLGFVLKCSLLIYQGCFWLVFVGCFYCLLYVSYYGYESFYLFF